MMILYLITAILLFTIVAYKMTILALARSIQAYESKLNENNQFIYDCATRIIESNEELEHIVDERSRKLKDVSESIENVVYVNGHRLRAPLARILGLTIVLASTASDSNSRQIAQMIKGESEDLDARISELNNLLSSLTSNQINININD